VILAHSAIVYSVFSALVISVTLILVPFVSAVLIQMSSSNVSSVPTALVIFDIDGVVRDVAGSYRRALADTVEHFTQGQYRPTPEDIDALKTEGCWNNDWEASRELIVRYFQSRNQLSAIADVEYEAIVDFFQSKYRGIDFSGYIRDEPLLMSRDYLENLTVDGIAWGFFSGATRASASYILKKRLGLVQPILIAMEDAPGKPDPTGLYETILQLSAYRGFEWNPANRLGCPIIYVGDTVADMHTIRNAQQTYPNQTWIPIGVIPPHVSDRPQYAQTLTLAGASLVLDTVGLLNSSLIFDQLCQ
jgi:HAD superfamily phosphatase